MGARSTSERYCFDRRWRDVRVHSLHDPLAYKAKEIGARDHLFAHAVQLCGRAFARGLVFAETSHGGRTTVKTFARGSRSGSQHLASREILVPVAETQRHVALLGRLAALGWFTRHGEVAATRSVAWLLSEPALREVLVRHLGELTGTDLSGVVAFGAEVADEKFGRPDLVGWDGRDLPLVVIEAKFGARLDPGQLLAYLTNQVGSLGGIRGALVVLVPSYRRPEAERVLSDLSTTDDEPSSFTPAVATAVLTWDALLDAWDNAAEQIPGDDGDAVVSDVRQLRALCETMAALDIAPLGMIAGGGPGWENRESDLKRLVDEATAEFRDTSPGRSSAPSGVERWPEFAYYRRYLPWRRRGAGQCCVGCLLGVVGGLPGTPFWLRYHRETPDFPTIARRVMASGFAAEARGEDGHVWLPLRVSPDRSGATIVGELIEQIEAIRAVAEGPPSA